MALQLSPEARNIIPEASKSSKKIRDCFSLEEKLVRAYIPSLPLKGRDAHIDLAIYCIVCGFLLRKLVLSHEYVNNPGMSKIVERACRRREERLEELTESNRGQVEGIVKREGMIMRILARKMDNRTRCVRRRYQG